MASSKRTTETTGTTNKRKSRFKFPTSDSEDEEATLDHVEETPCSEVVDDSERINSEDEEYVEETPSSKIEEPRTGSKSLRR